MPSSSAARVPLTLVVWRPTGDDDEEERHVTSWDLIISELPLLLDPAKSEVANILCAMAPGVNSEDNKERGCNTRLRLHHIQCGNTLCVLQCREHERCYSLLARERRGT